MKDRLVIIDGHSLLNRAYYAMRNPMITKEGIYTQGIYGFLNMLKKIKKDYEPEYMVVTFDKKAPTFRHKQFEDYKAGRKKMPPELAMEIPYLKEILTAMNIEIIEMEGFEADDLIGTIAKKGEENGLKPLIITGDKDALQLCSEKTEVLITKKGISVFELFDGNTFFEKNQFTPKEYIDVKALMGDQSDNIPGVAGIGEKTAHKLIIQYKSIENLYENIENLPKNKMREKLENDKMQAFMSKTLATINTEVPIEIDLERYKVKEPNVEELFKLYNKLEFKSFIKGLNLSDESINRDNISENQIKKLVNQMKKSIINRKSKLIEYLETLKDEENIYIKIFSEDYHKKQKGIYGIGIMSTNGIAFVNIEKNIESISIILDYIQHKKLKISGHFLIKDYFIMINILNKNEDEKYRKLCIEKGYLFETQFDSAISKYVLEPEGNKYDINIIAMEELSKKILSTDDFIKENSQISFLENNDDKFLDYFTEWIFCVLQIEESHKKRLQDEDLEQVYYDIELPLIEVLASMEVEGIKVDKVQLKEIGDSLSVRIEKLVLEIYQLAGTEFNVNSPMQLGNVLFERLQLPAGKKTKTGYSTSADILEKIKDKHEIVPKILEYRGLAKIKSTYVDGLMPLIDENSKIHAHFQQTGTATGRISCTEPNLQNIPIRQEEGRNLRKVFVAEDNKQFFGADYSQIELRVLAHMAEENHLVEAFNNGDDIHSITASRVFKVPENEVTALQRSNAKAVNFGVIYGMSNFGLSEELGISMKEAESYIDEYFKSNPKVKLFMDKQVEDAKTLGFVKTIFGRKRYIREINASNYMVRQMGIRLAMNSPVQGSAADIIKIAMVKVYRELNKHCLNGKLILQVHDELIIEADKEQEVEVEKILKDAMTDAVQLTIKLTVDFNKGLDWYHLK